VKEMASQWEKKTRKTGEGKVGTVRIQERHRLWESHWGIKTKLQEPWEWKDSTESIGRVS
jgi:hypothetical protein